MQHRVIQHQDRSGAAYNCTDCGYRAKYTYGVGWKVFDRGDGTRHRFGIVSLPYMDIPERTGCIDCGDTGDLPAPFAKFFKSKGWR